MAAAYDYAERGGQRPAELQMLAYLDRFGGAVNVLGRPLGAGEMRKMAMAENVVMAYQARSKSKNWAVWAQKNKAEAKLLEAALMAARGGEDG